MSEADKKQKELDEKEEQIGNLEIERGLGLIGK